MTTIQNISSIPNIIRLLFTGFLLIFGLRVITPMTNVLFGMDLTPRTRVVMVLVYWLIIFFLAWVLPWKVFFTPIEKMENGGNK